MKKDELAKKFRNFLDAETEWHYEEEERDDGAVIFSLNFSTDGTAISVVHLRVIVDEDLCFCRASVDMSAKGHCAEVGELLHRLNGHTIHGGNFWLDYEDGEIAYFQECVDFQEWENDAERFALLVHYPILVFEDWGDEMLKVILGTMTPEEAEKSALAKKKADSEKNQNE